MAAEDIDYQIKNISGSEYNSRFRERIPTPALAEGVDYTLALLFRGTNPEALTILSQVNFGERAKGALALALCFADKALRYGTILDDGVWLPDSQEPLIFVAPNRAPQTAIQGYFMPSEPDGAELTLVDFTERTSSLFQ